MPPFNLMCEDIIRLKGRENNSKENRKERKEMKRVTTIQVYRNRRNSNKYIEVHNDGHYHNSLKQYIFWEKNVITGESLLKPVKNITGDRRLHRWRKANLKELLEDYEPVTA